MRVCWIGLFAALLAVRASEPRPEIQGVVLEQGTGYPVAGADVSLMEMQGRPVAVTTTGLDGGFSFRPERFGDYRIEVRKHGWRSHGGLPGAAALVKLSEERPSHRWKAWMLRGGRLAGRVVDPETEDPIAGAMVLAWEADYRRGRRVAILPFRARTDPDGRFEFNDITPGDYLVQIAPRKGGWRIVRAFSEEDLEEVEHDFPPVFWPGGYGFTSAAPLRVASGGSVEVGVLKPGLAPLRRARVSLAPGACEAGGGFILWIYEEDGPREHPRRMDWVPCEAAFLVAGLAPGSYLLAAAGGESTNPVRGAVRVLIGEQDAEVVIPVSRGVDLEVRAIPPEGDVNPNLWLRLTPVLAGMGENRAEEVIPPGALRLGNVPITDYRLAVSVLRPGYYVGEIRYNGAFRPDRILRLNPAAISHTLEVVLGDDAAVLAGEVAEDGHPIEPHVVLAKWPVTGDVYEAVMTAGGGEDGRFRFTGLAPGEYRIAAVAREHANLLDAPYALERLLARGEKVTLTPAGWRRVVLKPADPR
jgi:hypothetical protein